MKYTHEITEGTSKGTKCVIFENLPERENQVYVRTDSGNVGASFWINKEFLKKIGVEMTFGLTEKNLEIIKKYTTRWEGAQFDRDTWVRIGIEIGWEPLTACLWYFKNHCK